MAYYIRIEKPREFRRDILEGSHGVIESLQAYRNLLALHDRKKQLTAQLQQELKEITLLIAKLDKILPEKQLREEAMREAKEEEKKRKIAQKRAAEKPKEPEKKSKAKKAKKEPKKEPKKQPKEPEPKPEPKKPASEAERLSSALDSIEKKLASLK